MNVLESYLKYLSENGDTAPKINNSEPLDSDDGDIVKIVKDKLERRDFRMTPVKREGAPALIGTTIAAVMGASAVTNAYTAYKERVREYGRTNKECIKKCEIRFNESNIEKHPENYSQDDIRRFKQNKQECIDKCNARFYRDMSDINARKEKIKKELNALRHKKLTLGRNK